MKKFQSVVVCALGALSLIGCGAPEVENSENETLASTAGLTAENLFLNQSVPGLSGSQGSFRFFRLMTVAVGEKVRVRTSGGVGDSDLCASRGALPTLTTCELVSIREGNDDHLILTTEWDEDWYIGVYGFAGYEGVTLSAERDGDFPVPGPVMPTISATPLPFESSTAKFGGRQGEWKYFEITSLPDRAVRLLIGTLSSGSGETNLYARRGALPTLTAFDSSSTSPGAGMDHLGLQATPGEGPWFIGVHAVTDFDDLQIRVSEDHPIFPMGH